MNERPKHYAEVEACVEETLRKVGKQVNLGTPLGLGKANHVVNEFFRRASEDSSIKLHIFTALTLARPHWKSELERRFLQPLTERLFDGYPELAYVEPLKRGTLPDNIRVTEFYFRPGSFLKSPLAQQSYMSSNYTHVVRDLLDAGLNVLAQLVAKNEEAENTRYSLSCNPDLTLDGVPHLREAERRGRKIAVLAQVNPNLPFMYGDAAVAPDYFDGVVDSPKYTFPLFGAPNEPVSTAEYMIALYVSTLIRDGGTLQIGIGALEDAVTYLLKLRHQQNGLYLEILNRFGVAQFGEVIQHLGGSGKFHEGLYASSEMLVDGFLDLYRAGILKRKVYQHAGLQKLLNDRRIDDNVTPSLLDALVEAGIISAQLTQLDFALLQKFGIFRPELNYAAGVIKLENGSEVPANLASGAAKNQIIQYCLGTKLRGGFFAHACFFLGPRKFYESLRQMDRAEREQISMTGISYVNELFGEEELKRLQRKAARFVNTGLLVTLLGAVASDGLEDGRVLSGVGGQYNFVAMAHALEDGRSIMMIRSTKEENGILASNIRWSYGHITIPRHLRDIVVTEYGVANLRGRMDEEVIIALLEIADSRFQKDLLKQAKAAGKVRMAYELPEHARDNRPERLERGLAPYREQELFPAFPFGTDLTAEEVVLRKSLRHLKRTLTWRKLHVPSLRELSKTIAMPDGATPYLKRMGLDRPHTFKERLLQRAVAYALASSDAI